MRHRPAVLARLLRCLLESAHKHARGRTGAAVQFRQLPGGAFFVCDNGAGFDPAYADKLFRPFEHLHGVGEFEGLGLGLAPARKLVERHGGRIWADSEPGRGAMFCFMLGSPA